ncbi:hypothetical protein [Streptomyces seoulensis]|uniref:hypothetical protein n=1 Tax=Streptomyces seoulensis TaxID=73044 RepID=UPI001FCC9B17|nr:hypothetical protein [Streptomyces seoulensis]BDH04904.1 hypothetical protein HEK131_21310 [Streptomyces seoulensis]
MGGKPVEFPDAVEVMCRYLRAALAAAGLDVRVGTRVPDPRPALFVRVRRVGGSRIDRITDRPRYDIECWGPDEEQLADLVKVTRALVFAMPGWRGVAAYDVADVGGPTPSPDPVSGQDRAAFAVEVSLRGRALSAL